MKKIKGFSLPADLLVEFDGTNPAMNRSQKLTAASRLATSPDNVIAAFVQRVNAPRPESPTSLIKAYVDDEVKDNLVVGVRMTGLPVEHVLRLAVERYISLIRAGDSDSNKESQDATAAGLQPAAGSGDHSRGGS